MSELIEQLQAQIAHQIYSIIIRVALQFVQMNYKLLLQSLLGWNYIRVWCYKIIK